MKKQLIYSTLVCALCCTALIFGSETASKKGNVIVGERHFPAADDYAIQELRAKNTEKFQNSEEISEGEEKPQVPTKKMMASSVKAKAKKQKDSDEDLQIKKKSIQNGIYVTSHPGAFHYAYAVGIFGESVQLEDGSIWTVTPADRYLTLNWLTTDDIVITPNQNPFSSYPMRLTNLQTGASVQAGLSVGPIYAGVFTHWIVAIDYYNDQICLEDGSIWTMSPIDHSIVKKWLINDTVIIGVNDGALSSIRPNILINVNVSKYALGNCIFY